LADAEEHNAPEEDVHPKAHKLTLWWKLAHLNKGLIILPFRPFSLRRGPGSPSRYRLIICDIIYDIPDLGMMSQFAIYDIIYDTIKLLLMSHIVIYMISDCNII
jgi:hypothetical protein